MTRLSNCPCGRIWEQVSQSHLQMELPPGFRFQPTDEELITHYLVRKVADSGFRAVAIGEADLNKCEPWDLPQRANMGEKEWYFFCVRDRKYPTGLRTNRATKAGYWKATGKDSAIYRGRSLVGMKKTLVFYRGRAPKGEKSNWVMHEYRLEGKHCVHNPPSKTAKNEWVVCRVFHKIPTVKKPIKPPGDLTDVNCHSSNVNEAAAATTAAREPAYVTCFSSAPGTFVDQLDEFLLTAPAELRRAAPPVAAEELISAPAPLVPGGHFQLLNHALWNC